MFSGVRLKECRIEKQYTQSNLANLLGFNRASYHKWESGKSVPNQKNLQALATILNVEPSYFEHEHNIVSNFLQLNEKNQLKAETGS